MDDAGKPMDSNPKASASSVDKFLNPSILLFIDQLILAAGGWAYWLVISKFATTSDIGHATTVYSLVLLVNTIIQLGLEYPLLKKSVLERKQILGIALVTELAITAASLPILLYSLGFLYQESQEVMWLAIGILVFSAISFITRYALLGLSNAKTILIFDILGTSVKFVAGFVLVLNGYGGAGILISFLVQSLTVALGTLLIATKSFGFDIKDIKLAKNIITDGLINLPTKLSRVFILSLSVVLLASFGASSSETGIFYIAVMISIAAASLASSISFMVLPASTASNTDLSSGSMRFGLSFTAPVITALVVAPSLILSIIGSDYMKADRALLILGISVLPSIISSNAISKFNNLQQSGKIVTIGLAQLSSFLIGFFILVPMYNIEGAALSILISFTLSSLLSVIWIERILLRYIATSSLSILAGWAVGYSMNSLLEVNIVTSVVCAIIMSFIINILLKNTSVAEISLLVRKISGK